MLMQVAGRIATNCDRTPVTPHVHPSDITGYHGGDYETYCLAESHVV